MSFFCRIFAADMKYHVAHIRMRMPEEWQEDVFTQQLSELGFDTFERSEENLSAYIPSESWEQNKEEIEALCASTEGVQLIKTEACPDENWNAVWESEHTMEDLPLGVRIIPHCAFGAGHHETTSMMVEALLDLRFQIADGRFDVLDHGTGTGILAIFAKKVGAERVVAVDIDEKSVVNARENAALNGVEIEVLHSSCFTFEPASFNLILANIHRNILVDYMPRYAAALRAGGECWISGFYEEDCPMLMDAAEAHGLRMTAKHECHEWRMMRLAKV